MCMQYQWYWISYFSWQHIYTKSNSETKCHSSVSPFSNTLTNFATLPHKHSYLTLSACEMVDLTNCNTPKINMGWRLPCHHILYLEIKISFFLPLGNSRYVYTSLSDNHSMMTCNCGIEFVKYNWTYRAKLMIFLFFLFFRLGKRKFSHCSYVQTIPPLGTSSMMCSLSSVIGLDDTLSWKIPSFH